MGFDVSKDTTLVVSLDIQGMVNAMGDYEEQAMMAEVLRRWQAAWKAQHPGKHATLHVRSLTSAGTSSKTRVPRRRG